MNPKIYVASSWRNDTQPLIVRTLRADGYHVYDFRHPAPDKNGFSWSEIDPGWKSWSPLQFRNALETNIAHAGFVLDWTAMCEADGCVLVLPCGRSAHIEAGYFVGSKKPLFILQTTQCEPELMYKMATSLCLSVGDLLQAMDQSFARFAPSRFDAPRSF